MVAIGDGVAAASGAPAIKFVSLAAYFEWRGGRKEIGVRGFYKRALGGAEHGRRGQFRSQHRGRREVGGDQVLLLACVRSWLAWPGRVVSPFFFLFLIFSFIFQLQF
jgi:hypothetical protein